MKSFWLIQSSLLITYFVNALQLAANNDVQQCNGKSSRESPQSHRMGSTPDRQPRAAYYHTDEESVNDNILSRRAHCRYFSRGRGKSLEDAKLDHGPVQLCSIVRDAIKI